MRVLHVIDAGRPLIRDFARPAFDISFDNRILTCKLVRDASRTSHDHRICLLGSRVAAQRASVLGLQADYQWAPMLRQPRFTVGAMSRLIRTVRPDLVHWWSEHWTGGCFGRPGRAWRLESVLGTTPLRLPVWLSAPIALTCGPVERQTAQVNGFAPIDVEAPTLAPPSAEAPLRRGDALRVLGLGPDADPRKFVFLCSLMGQIGVTVCPIIPTTNQSLRRMRRFYHLLERPLKTEFPTSPLSEVLRSCDVALWMGGPRGPSAINVRTCLAAGVPVIVPPDGAWAIPESLRPMLVARNSTPGELARIVQLHAERADGFRLVPARPATFSNAPFTQRILTAYEGGGTADEFEPAASHPFSSAPFADVDSERASA